MDDLFFLPEQIMVVKNNRTVAVSIQQHTEPIVEVMAISAA